MVRGREVEVAGRAAQVQDGAGGAREGVEGRGEGRAELLWVVPRVVLRDDLLRAGREEAGGRVIHVPDLLGAAMPHVPGGMEPGFRLRPHQLDKVQLQILTLRLEGPPARTQFTHQTKGSPPAYTPPRALVPPLVQR